MKHGVVLALVASLAHAQAADAPVLEPVGERPAMELKAGEAVPFDGTCMTTGKSIEVGKRIASCEAEMAKVEEKTVLSTPVLVAGVVGLILVSFAAGAATAYAVKR